MAQLKQSQLFGLRLKKYRLSMGYSQKEFGKMLSLAQNTICKYESDGINDIDIIYEIKHKFGIDLLSDEEEDIELKEIILNKIYEWYGQKNVVLLTRDLLQTQKLFGYGTNNHLLDIQLQALEQNNLIRLYQNRKDETDKNIYILMTAKGILKINPIGSFLPRFIVENSTEEEFQSIINPLSEESDGIYYGKTFFTNKNLFLQRKKMSKPHALVMGPAGSGKHKVIENEIIEVMKHTNDDIQLINLYGEYNSLVNELEGKIIEINQVSGNHINPLDLYIEDETKIEQYLSQKMECIEVLCSLALHQTRLMEEQYVEIVKCINLIYEPYLTHIKELKKEDSNIVCVPEFSPTLVDLYEKLNEQPNIESKKIASALGPFCIGHLNLFAHKTNIVTDNRFIIYNLEHINDDLLKFALVSCLEQVLGHMMKKATWTYIDSATSFLRWPLKSYILKKFNEIDKAGSLITLSLQSIDNFETETVSPITEAEFLSYFGLITVLHPLITHKVKILECLDLYLNIDGLPNDKENYMIFQGRVIPYYLE